MKNYQRSILVSVGILAVLALGYFLLTYDNSGKYNWSESYTQKEKDPYCTFVISEMLKSYFPEKEFTIMDDELHELLPGDPDQVSNYVFIGNRLYLDSLNQETLLEFVKKGNQAFIATTSIPYDLVLALYARDCEYKDTGESDVYIEDEYVDETVEEDFYDEEDYEINDFADPAENTNYWSGLSTYFGEGVNLQFSHTALSSATDYPFIHQYRNKEESYFWKYIDDATFCEGAMDFEILGRMGLDSVNFLRVPYGEGYVYLHTMPIVFTNYQMIEENGLAYAGKAFSHLQEGDIFWDEKSKTYEYPKGNSPRGFSQSPLQYILSQKSLKWSWYMGLALTFLYVLFRAKRRQRIIPILHENTNTSLEFIKTIGRLYYQQNEHKKLASQEMKLFLSYIRDHYHIPTLHLDEALTKKISVKSEVPVDEVDKIFRTWNKIKKSPEISEHTLIYFHGQVDDFYRNSK